jgi:hypothetical protein
MRTYLYILILILSLSLIGCFKSGSNVEINDKKITNGDIFALIIRSNKIDALNYNIYDQIYVTPSKKWIEKEFSSDLNSFFFNNNLLEGEQETWDCEDYTRATHFLITKLYKNSSTKQSLTAIAFGEFYYITDEGTNHAINMFIVQNEFNQLELVFYEPQERRIVELTEMEKKSCLFWKI